MHLGCLIVPEKDSQVLIGLIGLSDETISAKKRGYCWFPIGEPDPRYRGGRVWERVKVAAIGDIRANYDVLVIDDKKNVKEYSLKVSELKEETLLNNAENIEANSTESTGAFETTGYNKITGYIYAETSDITVYVDQSNDGQNWDVESDVFTGVYTAGDKDGAFSVEIVARYARARFDNATANDTTNCRKIIKVSSGA